MAFVVRIEIIAVNNSNGIVQLQAVFESKTASWIAFQHPLLIHLHTDSCWELDCLTRLDSKIHRGKEIITRTSSCGTSWQTDSLVNLLCFLHSGTLKSIHPVCHEALFTYFMKFPDSLHNSSCKSHNSCCAGPMLHLPYFIQCMP